MSDAPKTSEFITFMNVSEVSGNCEHRLFLGILYDDSRSPSFLLGEHSGGFSKSGQKIRKIYQTNQHTPIHTFFLLVS